MHSEVDEIHQAFIAETRELMAEVEGILVDLERGEGVQADPEALNAIFRAFHSTKGTAGFLELSHVVRATHRTESLLDQIRQGQIALTAARTTVLLRAVDLVQNALGTLERTGSDETIAAEADAIVAAVDEVIEGGDAPKVAIEADFDDFMPPLVDLSAAGPAPEPEPEPASAPLPPTPSRPASQPVASARPSIRVDLAKLDQLVNLVGELLIAQDMVLHNQDLQGLTLDNFSLASRQLNRITRDLQDLAMTVRMVPLRGTLRKMSRLVRDLSHKQGKTAQLVVLGEDTEVDRTVIEHIGDPLVHLIRNAVDHGIEPAEQRTAAGKPAMATVHLEARHEGGEVWIVLRDDGRGLDRDRILAKAVERGLVAAGATMTDSDVYKLIFLPGFSTADAVTDVSGRGVGMDVVHRNLASLRGHIDVVSTPGVGTTFTLRIPLTLAIVEGMLVRVGAHRYTVPLFSVSESMGLSHTAYTELPDGSEMVRIRGRLLRLVRLNDVFGQTVSRRARHDGLIVVVESGPDSVALVVDEVLGLRQTVIKPLPACLGRLDGLGGCSILSDGKVSLILDIKSLIGRIQTRQEIAA